MAVVHDAHSESHAGTSMSASEPSFTWNHDPVGTPQSVCVFVIRSTGGAAVPGPVTYDGVELVEDTDANAIDTAGEPQRVWTFFLGTGVPSTDPAPVVVNRTNNANEMYAVCVTQTADGETEITGIALLEGDGTLSEQAVDDGSPGTDSLRYAAAGSGLGSVPAPGANSTALASIDVGARVAAVVRETTAGPGSRSVGFSDGGSDDRAVVHIAISEIADGGADEISAAGGIASAEAHGTPSVRFVVLPLGIGTAEVLGSPWLTRSVQPLGIASAEALGETKLVRWVRQAGGIASAAALGQPTLGITLLFSVGGIASQEALGQPRLTRILRPVGLVSGEAFGATSLIRLLRQAGGIASQEALGTARVLRVVRGQGVASAEAFGQPRLVRLIHPVAIASLLAFGVTTVGDFEAPSDSVFGQVFVSDEQRYGVLVMDDELYLVEISDVERFGAGVSDRPGG